MKIALQLETTEDDARYAQRVGVKHAVWGGPEGPEGYLPLERLAAARDFFAARGLELGVIENVPVSFYHRAMLGLPGRDEQIDNYCRTLRHMGRAGIMVLGYHWMALGGISTNQIRGRGGALERRFDLDDALQAPAAALDWRGPVRAGRPIHLPDIQVSAEEMWANLTYFLSAVLPVAEAAGVRLAAHPDDAPIPSFLGVARILGSPEGLQRLLDAVPSPCSGIDFCQGTISEMPGVDVVQAIRRFGSQGKIFFAHFRDTRGTVPGFTEVFMDEGDTDMVAAVEAYRAVGFNGFLRADHTPHVIGDRQARRGFAFQVGYMRGLEHAVGATRPAPARPGAGAPALALTVDPWVDEEVIFAQQLGAEKLVAHAVLPGTGGEWDTGTLRALRNRVEQTGLRLAGLDSLPCPFDQALRGTPEGDAQAEAACRFVHAAGAAGIPLVGVDLDVPHAAGRALRTDQEGADGPGGPDAAHLASLERFLERVAPVARQAGVRLACRIGGAGLPVSRTPRSSVAASPGPHPAEREADWERLARILSGPWIGLDLPLRPAVLALATVRGLGERILLATDCPSPQAPADFTGEADGLLVEVVRVLRQGGFAGCLRPARYPSAGDESGERHEAMALGLGYLRALLQGTEPGRGGAAHG
ncbi:MAG: mannonate dehydratase [Candidatus Latescibacterota bacterium]